MVIQRIQTVYLLCAAVLTALSLSASVVSAPEVDYAITANPVMLIVGVLAALLMVVDIFMFRNLPRQKVIAAVAAFLVGCMIVGELVFIFMLPATVKFGIGWSIPLQVLAIVLTLLARHCMAKDQKLLSGYDRIR